MDSSDNQPDKNGDGVFSFRIRQLCSTIRCKLQLSSKEW